VAIPGNKILARFRKASKEGKTPLQIRERIVDED
jgi:hypothetical protein